MSTTAAISIEGMTHRYGQRTAVDDLSLAIDQSELFVFLGPNGSGKSTLFRVLSTLVPLQQGSVAVLGLDLRAESARIRRKLGVVFQSPSLDGKLTVAENIHCHGRLFGLGRGEIQRRMGELLESLGLAGRVRDYVETLSGGMRRRVELAKALLPQPQLLLLDEPSTGLDPAARGDLWDYLRRARGQQGTTVVLTSHLLDEAERADRIAIMDLGKLAALDAPRALRSRVQGDAITIEAADQTRLAADLKQRFDLDCMAVDSTLRLELEDGPRWVSRLMDEFPEEIRSISLGKPTLEDVFIDLTGRRFNADTNEDAAAAANAKG